MPSVFLRSLLSDSDEHELHIRRFPCVIGRQHDCNVQIVHPWVSRRHCAFVLQDGQVFLQDLKSSHGTTLNGTRLEHPQIVRSGDLITLPCGSFHARVPSDSGKLSSRHHCVLVVDDNKIAANMLAQLMERMGNDVYVADTGPSAIKTARACHPDLIFVDIHMPEMDGYELADHLRHEPGLERARMLAVTGYPQDENPDRLQEVGIGGVLIKPVDVQRLRNVLTDFSSEEATGP